MKNILLIVVLVIISLTVGFASGYVWGSRINSSSRESSFLKDSEELSSNDENEGTLLTASDNTVKTEPSKKKTIAGEAWWNEGDDKTSVTKSVSFSTETPTPTPAPPETVSGDLREVFFSEIDPDFTFPARKERYFYNGPEDSKIIALTYDDGPHNLYTRPLLQVLEEENAPATFFLLGQNAERSPDIVSMIHEAGCETGNHSYTHPNLRKLTPEKVREEITATSDEIESATRIEPKVFRPPYGSSGEHVAQIAYELHLDIFLWNLDTNDYKNSVTSEDIVKNIVTNVRGGSIILMHDKSRKVIDATREVIPILRERGYEFVTCSELARRVRLAKQESNKKSESAYQRLKGD